MKYLLYACFFALIVSFHADAALTFRNGKLINSDQVPRFSAEEHFSLGADAFNNREWQAASDQFLVIVNNYPCSEYYGDALYWLGVTHFYEEEYEFANRTLSEYLQTQNNPQYYEDAVSYKFAIAEAFRKGAKRRIMGYRQMPKWLLATEMAYEIYDEVIAAMPTHPIAAKALFCKGVLHWYSCDYREAVDSFSTLIRRFPKNSLAPESYLTITQIYLEQSEKEFQNPDLLHLADLNLKKFQVDFPTDERLYEAEYLVRSIHEVHAKGLYHTGQFYERVCQPNASILYYQNAIDRFPNTECAGLCRERLYCLLGENYDDCEICERSESW